MERRYTRTSDRKRKHFLVSSCSFEFRVLVSGPQFPNYSKSSHHSAYNAYQDDPTAPSRSYVTWPLQQLPQSTHYSLSSYPYQNTTGTRSRFFGSSSRWLVVTSCSTTKTKPIRTQTHGSCNPSVEYPAHSPPVDLDDGPTTYLPMSAASQPVTIEFKCTTIRVERSSRSVVRVSSNALVPYRTTAPEPTGTVASLS